MKDIQNELEGLFQHKDVVSEIEFARDASGKSLLEIDFVCKKDGYMLVCFFSNDLHMARLADGAWVRCYLGMDDEYNRNVLEVKYSLTHAFTVDRIHAMQDVKIYI